MGFVQAWEERARRRELRWLAYRSEPVSWGVYVSVALMYAFGSVLSLMIVWWLADRTTPDDGDYWPWLLLWPLIPLGVVALAGCAVGLIVWLVTGRRQWD